MQIRTPLERDWEGWLRLRRELWPSEDPDSYRVEMRGMVERPDDWGVFVCVDPEEQVIGFAEVSMRQRMDSIEPDRVGHLEGWYVAAEHRRSGIGRRLVEATVAWVKKRGSDVLNSDADLDNLVSHRAHAALGFVETHREVQFRRRLE